MHTHYQNSNLIWRTVSRRVDEVITSNHPRRVALRVFNGMASSTRDETVRQIKILL